MKTNKAYQENVYARELSAIVTDISFNDGITSIVCDRTIFYPTGGGQPCDNGYIEDYFIFDVIEDEEGMIVHRTKDIESEELSEALLGTEVNMAIDWDIRFRNMQRHLGEHLLSGAFYKLFCGKNRGFHMGEDYITIDIEIPDALLSDDMIKQAEILANKAIQMNMPVSVSYFENSTAASKLPVRKPIDIKGPVSVVTAGESDYIADCVACCGTHPSHTGEVGLIKIYKHELNKGMTRIYFDVGMDALNRCIKHMDILKEISDHFSCGESDLYNAIIAKEDNESDLKNRVSKLSSTLISMKVGYISEEIICENLKGLYVINENVLDIDRSLKMGYKLIDNLNDYTHINKLLIAIIAEDNNVILLSNGTISCGELIKKYIKSFNGKGGGRDNNGRAKFESIDDLNSFLDKIGLELNR